MELKGKLLFGLVGIIVGGLSGLPFGVLIGFVFFAGMGHLVYDLPREQALKHSEVSEFYRRRGNLLYFVFALGAKLAKADGPVNQGEIQYMERLLRHHFKLQPAVRAELIRVWNQSKASGKSFDDYARLFYQQFSRQRYEVLNMMDILFGLAAADGRLHPREEQVLRGAAGIFHISGLQYDRIKSRYFQTSQQPQKRWTPLDPYYALLGAEPTDSLEVIKKKFRALALKWHPDQLMARGASSEALRHGKEKLQQINEAYEKIVQSRQG